MARHYIARTDAILPFSFMLEDMNSGMISAGPISAIFLDEFMRIRRYSIDLLLVEFPIKSNRASGRTHTHTLVESEMTKILTVTVL